MVEERTLKGTVVLPVGLPLASTLMLTLPFPLVLARDSVYVAGPEAGVLTLTLVELVGAVRFSAVAILPMAVDAAASGMAPKVAVEATGGVTAAPAASTVSSVMR